MEENTCDLYIGSMGQAASLEAFKLVSQLRNECGLYAECDLIGRSVKAQMKYANKIGAKYSVILGDNELAEGKAKVKNMATGESTELALGEQFAEAFADHMNNEMQESILSAEGLEGLLG